MTLKDETLPEQWRALAVSGEVTPEQWQSLATALLEYVQTSLELAKAQQELRDEIRRSDELFAEIMARRGDK